MSVKNYIPSGFALNAVLIAGSALGIWAVLKYGLGIDIAAIVKNITENFGFSTGYTYEPDALKDLSKEKSSKLFDTAFLQTIQGSTLKSNVKFASDIEEAADKWGAYYGINGKIVRAIIKVESNGNPNVTGSYLEAGLMQVTPIALDDYNKNYGSEIVVQQLYYPLINIQVGCGFLALQRKRMNNSLIGAIRAYNAGEAGAKRGNGYQYLNRVVDQFDLNFSQTESDKSIFYTAISGGIT